MALDMILLGFLETPAAGYDLKREFDESVRHFWDAELSQIYPTLHRLRRDGLVTVSEEPSDQGPVRKVYRRTAAGLEALRGWLESGPLVETQRIEHLAQLFFLGETGDPDRTRGFIEDLREAFDRRLSALRAIEAHHREGRADRPPNLSVDEVHPYLTLLYGIRRMEATVDWCDESLELLAELGGDGNGGRA